MPGMDGVTATRRITEQYPDVDVVVLTSYSDQQRVLEAMDAGAIGYVLKDTDPVDLLAAIRSAAQGHSPWTPASPARSCTAVGAPHRRPS